MEELIREWTIVCAGYDRQIDLMERGAVQTYGLDVDTTQETIERTKSCRHALEGLIVQYEQWRVVHAQRP